MQLLGQIVNHYQAPDDPGCDFTGLLEAVHEVPGLDRIRFASPHPRHFSARFLRRDGAAPEDLPAPAPARAVRLDARAEAMRRRYTRESYLDVGRPDSRDCCRTSRSRPI